MSDARLRYLPAPWLPLTYFAGAHLALLLACVVLVVRPELPGAFHYHPRMIAVTHLVTLGWISGSILGALYIVAPLALGMTLPAGRADVVAAVAFWGGAAGMVAGFWYGRYDIVGTAALPVTATLIWVGVRVWNGLRTARVPWGVGLHIVLAFANVILAAMLGIVSALGRRAGWFDLPVLGVSMAHAHLAALGWAVMMIVGVAYRLVPMFLPAAMPTGSRLAWSAALLECGALGIAWTLATDGPTLLLWVACVVAAGACFTAQMRLTLANRRPRPAALDGRDWSTWQTHTALAWGAVSVCVGTWVATEPGPTAWTWAYAVTGLVGFIAQMVVGIEGRLLPMHAWYVAMRQEDGRPSMRAAHTLTEGEFALAIFVLWAAAVPLLAFGVSLGHGAAIRAAAGALATAIVLQLIYGIRIVRRAGRPVATAAS